MPERKSDTQERRANRRRESDRVDYTCCPKYMQHDLTSEQTKEIIEEIIDIVFSKIDNPDRRKDLLKDIYKDMKADAFDEGKGALYRVVVLIGIIATTTYAWFSNHPLK